MQPPQKSLHSCKIQPSYIQQLRKASEEKLIQCKHLDHQEPWEPLEIQIRRWWINLPPVMQQRRFQIVEIASQCKSRCGSIPAWRDVACALRVLGWQNKRDWTVKGRNARYWISYPGDQIRC